MRAGKTTHFRPTTSSRLNSRAKCGVYWCKQLRRIPRCMKFQKSATRLAICIDDGGYVDDLKVRTVYKVLRDETTARSNYIRVIDETGEDYVYPSNLFVPIQSAARNRRRHLRIEDVIQRCMAKL